MTVNPFWFGFLMAIVALIVIGIIASLIRSKDDEGEITLTEEQFAMLFQELTGKPLYGESVEDKDDDDCK